MTISKLKLERIRRGYSQWDIARKLKTSQQMVSLFENGFLQPSREQKKRLAKILRKDERILFPQKRQEESNSGEE